MPTPRVPRGSAHRHGLYGRERGRALSLRLAILLVCFCGVEQGARLLHGFPAAGSAAAQGVSVEPSQFGQWSGLAGWPAAAAHAMLLETGKIMTWSDGNAIQIWDPATGSLTPAPHAPSDIAGAGHVTQADGTPIVIGGRSRGPGSWGAPDANLFNPASQTWTPTRVMNRFRWRPTGTVLPDGRILVTGGSDTCPACEVPIPEVYDPGTLAWSVVDGLNSTMPAHPFMFVVPDGRVLLAGSPESPSTTQALDVATGVWTTVDPRVVDGGSAAMFLPGRVMKSGSASTGGAGGTAARTSFVLDMDQAAPRWQPSGLMVYPRAFHNLTVLPDGSVAATGGQTGTASSVASLPVLPAEIWSPATRQWTAMAGMQAPRLHESVSLLLPDGRILVAGSTGEPGAADQPRAEIFAPPYLFKGRRPRVTSVPTTIDYNSEALVATPDSEAIESVALVRTGSVTHSFNQDQRFVPLAFHRVPGGVAVIGPPDPNLAPPGSYLLFILNGQGVPSVGSFVRLPPAVAAPSSAASNTAVVESPGPAAAAVAAGVTIDAVAWGDQSSTAATTVTSSAFSTTAGNELLLAFVSAGSTSTFGTNTTITSVTGAGLTWQLAARTNVQRGTAEIWRAFAAAALANVTVTAQMSRSTTSALSVVSFTGVDVTGTNGSGAIGAIKSANGTSGAPTATLTTTRNNSWVFGVGSDRDAAVARTLGLDQTLIHQYLPSSSNDTYWAQRLTAPTPASGTNVTINDTAPTAGHYNLTLCEILPPDLTPPTVTAVTPANGATNVLPSATVTATFSKAMAAATITTATMLLRDSSNTAVPGTVAYNATTRVATLTPSAPLANAKTYTATVVSGAAGVTDASGMTLVSDVIWTFSVPADTTPPTVTAVTPASGATNVSTSAVVTATFSEPMTAVTITAATVLLTGPGSTSVAGTVAYNAATRVATLTPAAPLAASTVFTARVKSGASGVQDAAGNPLATDRVWTFTTGVNNSPPTVTGKTPANGAVGVATTTAVTATFSKAMRVSTIIPTTILLSAGSEGIPATVTYNAAALTATLRPVAELIRGTAYTVTVKGGEFGAADSSGNAVVSDVTWAFTTAPDATPPASSITAPANASTVNGTVSVAVAVSDDVAVGGVQVMLDGANLGTASSWLAWDLQAPDPATANSYSYQQYRDGGTSGVPLSGVICVAGSIAGTQTCAIDLAALAPAPHTVQITAGNPNGESLRSPAFALTNVPYWIDWDSAAAGNGSHTLAAVARDAAGNTANAAPISVTVGNDSTPPTLTGGTPPAGATNIAPSTTVTATFSEPMAAGTIGVATVLLRDPGNSTLAATVSYDGPTRTATLVPALALGSSTTYTATVKGGSGGVTDSAGNALVSDATWSFTTAADTTPPTVTGAVPAAGASNVSLASAVTATFSEAMDAATITAATVLLRDPGNTAIPATVSYTTATKTALLTPAASLSYATTYTAVVTSGVRDVAGNALASDLTWSFTTVGDTTPPTVTGVTPAGGATSIAPSSTVTATFNEAMTSGTITAATVLLRDPVNAPVAATVGYSAATRTATLTPAAALSTSTTYTARVVGGSGGVKDSAGNPLAADYVWTFTTSADTTPPIVIDATPADGASGVAITTTVTTTFSEPMTAGTIGTTTVLLRDPLGALVAAAVSYSTATRTATLTPAAALASSTAYTATVKSGSTGVKDASGNPLTADYVWAFTTGADTTPPTVTGVTPAAGATGVATLATVTATFSEPMSAATIGATTVVLRDPLAAVVAATVTYSAATRTATLTPAAALANAATYTATVTGGSGGVTDAAGNALTGDYTWTFTTSADTTPPTVTGVTPAAGATGVPNTTAVTAVFSEPMTAGTISATTFLLRDPINTPIAATVTYSAATRTATLTPSAALAYSTAYTATVKGGVAGVKDASANALAVDYVWVFTTGTDTTPPTVTAVTPLVGATAVATMTTVTATFSEAMTAATIGATTVLLRDPLNTAIAATVTYSAATRTVTLTPTAALANGTTYTATVKGGAAGVKDVPGNPLAADYVWSFTTVPDTTPPVVTAVTPVNGTTGVAAAATVTATFNEAMTAATISTATVLLRDPLNATIAATVTYNTTTRTVTLTPAAALTDYTIYTATVTSGATGVKDAAGNALAADYVWSFTTGPCPCSLWTATTTPGPAETDANAVELGMKFRADVNGFVTGVRFYKYSANTGTHTGSLWSSTGTLLGRVTFAGETASGWQQATFTTPIAVTANTTYVISYHTNTGRYAATSSGLTNAVDKAPLHGLASGSSGGNGVYIYGTASAFPNLTFSASNYWVDVIFRP